MRDGRLQFSGHIKGHAFASDLALHLLEPTKSPTFNRKEVSGVTSFPAHVENGQLSPAFTHILRFVFSAFEVKTVCKVCERVGVTS
eukprot:1184443-Prorocentrum_minimum.AAC.8